MGFVLHVVPDSVGNAAKPFVGSTKDVRGRTEYFAERGVEVREYLSAGRSDAELLAHLQTLDLSDCDAVLFEYETYLESMTYLRQAYPHVLRLVRAHNANFLHQIDNFLGRQRMGDPVKSASDIRVAWERFDQDVRCAELADVILAITDWEAVHYWTPLAGAGRVVSVPYFLPNTFDFSLPRPKERKFCVCFMGTGGTMTPLLYDAARNTIDLVAAAGSALEDWEFAITGQLKPATILDPLGRVRATGLLPSPIPVLQEARAVTLLSDLGMGFKTKILEAISAGCWVLVTPDVWDRLPEAVRPWCKAVRKDDVAGFVFAIRACELDPPVGDPNAALRAQAFSALDRVFSARGKASPA